MGEERPMRWRAAGLDPGGREGVRMLFVTEDLTVLLHEGLPTTAPAEDQA